MSVMSMINAPSTVRDLLRHLHQLSEDQETRLHAPNGGWAILRNGSTPHSSAAAISARDDLMRDKFIALTADKASFVYNLLRATHALNVVEAGTSFGVSTIYLALAVGQNALAQGKTPGEAKVIATEFEPTKAAQARKHWQEAGETVEPWVDLREGDLLQTLEHQVPQLDAVLFDIWTPMVLPTLQLLEPHFRTGTVLILDNVISSKEGYMDFYTYIQNGPYTSVTLPYEGGLGMVVYNPS